MANKKFEAPTSVKFEAPTSVKSPAKSTGTKTPAKKAVAKKEPKGERKASTFRLRNDAKAVWSAFTGQKGEIVGALVKLGAVGAKAAGVTTAAICKALPKVAPKNVAFYMSVWQTKTDPAVVEKIAAC